MTRRWRIARVTAILAANLVLLAGMLESGAWLLYPSIRDDEFTWTAAVNQLHRSAMLEDLSRGDRAKLTGEHADALLHPYLAWVSDPNLEVINRRGERVHPISRLGFMGGDVRPKSSENEVVIGLSGGSVAGGFWLEGRRALLDALAADSRFKGKTLRVENFSMAGYKQPQALFTLLYLLAQGAQFDIWLNLDGFNDVALPVSENLPAGVAIQYPRGWPSLVGFGSAPQELELLAERNFLIAGRERLRRSIADSILSRSALVVACWDLADRNYSRRIVQLDQRLRDRVAGLASGPAAQGPQYGQPRPSFDEALRLSVELWKSSSRLMSQVCAANGIAYYHFLQPNQYLSGSKPFSKEEQRTAFAEGGYRPAAEAGYPLLVQAAEELRAEGVSTIDLTRAFDQEASTIYVDSCCHVNALGNRIMAGRMAQAILESPAP